MHPYHGVGGHISHFDVLRLSVRVSGNDFDPVAIRVKYKSNVPHSAVRKLLLELVARILEALARRLDIVHADTEVTKTTVRLLIAIVDLVLRI